ncbi:MAG: Fic family protein [Gammaproteobacteria bacterium]|nr:Fic family protein [Gammaproteobacteria bacterium]
MKSSEKTTWKPIIGLPDNANTWGLPEYANLVSEWHQLVKEITDKNHDKTNLNIWLRERRRAFAIETGQIEGLYTLKRGITEQLITEGLSSAVSSHTEEGIDDKIIKGLLTDQQTALEAIFSEIKDRRPLSHFTLKSWHQLLTRHQETVTGLRPQGDRMVKVQVEFKRKGEYKLHPNNPRRPDGTIHEYCPPEHVQSEMDRFFDLYDNIRRQNLPTEVEAAWLHHRFVAIHPFQDGNGRVSRLLMAHVYSRKNELPPVISTENKAIYIDALENADRGDLRAFSDLLGGLASVQTRSAVRAAKNILEGKHSYSHANGAITSNGIYYPPENAQ